MLMLKLSIVVKIVQKKKVSANHYLSTPFCATVSTKHTLSTQNHHNASTKGHFVHRPSSHNVLRKYFVHIIIITTKCPQSTISPPHLNNSFTYLSLGSFLKRRDIVHILCFNGCEMRIIITKTFIWLC